MGRGPPVGKKRVVDYARSKQPKIVPAADDKLSFKELKRRSIVAGLRCLRAPAAAWLFGSSPETPTVLCGPSLGS